MRLAHIFAPVALLLAAAASNADTRVIEGRGAAANKDRLKAQFEGRVAQVNNNAATGRFAVQWKREAATITIVCEHPASVMVREHEGRMTGPAKVTVVGHDGTKSWEGTVFLTVVDNKGNGD